MARPNIHEDPVKLTLYVEKTTRARAQSISKELSVSTSALFSKLIKEYTPPTNDVTPVETQR